MRTVIAEIVQALNEGPVLWAGNMPARHDMTLGDALYDPRRDFRCPPEFHQAFALTYIVERDLATLKQWPLILDEALRTLRPGGIIVIRLKENALLSIFQLANFLERWTGGCYEPLEQISDQGHFVLAVRLTHSTQRPAAPDGWSFGLVTDGRKPASVAAFVRSVLAIDGLNSDRRQILICGPAEVIENLGALGDSIQLVEQPSSFADQGWITRKKNSLVAAAGHENVLIAHDRYVLPTDFLKKMSAFGGDFDVVVPRQVTTEGASLPDWVMVSDYLGWSVPGWIEYGDYHPFGFVNGGVIIAKRKRLVETRWSELLFWGQAEDIDLSRRLADRGVTPRLARAVELVSEPPRSGFIEGFERLPWREGQYLQTDRPDYGRTMPLGVLGTAPKPLPPMELDRPVELAGANTRGNVEKSGLILSSGWAFVPRGAEWQGSGVPELSFKISETAEALALVIDFPDVDTARAFRHVTVNGVACTVTFRSDTGVEMEIPPNARAHGMMFHVQAFSDSRQPLVIKAVSLTSPMARGHDLMSPIFFKTGISTNRWLRRGWRPVEPWGVWTRSTKAEIRIPLAVKCTGPLRGTADLIADFRSDKKPQTVSITCEGRLVGQWTLTPGDQRKQVSFVIDRPVGAIVTLIVSSGLLHDGLGGKIGVGIQQLTLTRGDQ